MPFISACIFLVRNPLGLDILSRVAFLFFLGALYVLYKTYKPKIQALPLLISIRESNRAFDYQLATLHWF